MLGAITQEKRRLFESNWICFHGNLRFHAINAFSSSVYGVFITLYSLFWKRKKNGRDIYWIFFTSLYIRVMGENSMKVKQMSHYDYQIINPFIAIKVSASIHSWFPDNMLAPLLQGPNELNSALNLPRQIIFLSRSLKTCINQN